MNFILSAAVLLLAHLAKGQVSLCHHLVYVIFVVDKFSKSSPLKLLDRQDVKVAWLFLKSIVLKMTFGIYDPWKNVAAIIKIRK